ncbi:MAG: UbiA family prenyltransferase [Candidatus Omnitrophica bacterium]|nr:UbiA family prenyltransferase [Candidatus Omnitrophota bacterium]
MFQQWVNSLKKFFDYIESEDIPLSYYFFTFLSVVMLRTFWEHALLIREPSFGGLAEDLFHFTFFYASLAITLILVFYLLTKQKVGRLARLVMSSFIILNIVPIIDRLSGARDFFHVTYYFPQDHKDIFYHFIAFFGPLEKYGATPGMRIEIALILIATAVYIFVRTRQLWRSILSAVLVYIVIFGYLATPFLINAGFGIIGMNAEIDIFLIIRFYLALIFVGGLAVLYLAEQNVFKELIKDARLPRLFHYVLLILLGVVMYRKFVMGFVSFGQNEIFRLFFLAVSVSFAWIFSVVTNNWADEDIDRISNPTRPMITGSIAKDLYRRIGWGILIAALVYALAVDAEAFNIMMVFIGNYFLYSMPPFRFKRVPVLSKAVIGFNSLLVFMLGFMVFNNSANIPLGIIIFFLVFVTASANFIDLKDYEGDLKVGIKTLPVIVGVPWAKRLIGGAFILTYIVAYDVFRLIGCFWICLAMGLAQCFFINRKNYDERPVLGMYIVSLIFIIIYKTVFM